MVKGCGNKCIGFGDCNGILRKKKEKGMIEGYGMAGG